MLYGGALRFRAGLALQEGALIRAKNAGPSRNNVSGSNRWEEPLDSTGSPSHCDYWSSLLASGALLSAGVKNPKRPCASPLIPAVK